MHGKKWPSVDYILKATVNLGVTRIHIAAIIKPVFRHIPRLKFV